MTQVVNFSAGPALLPAGVLAAVAAELEDFDGSGMSLLEMSHRSADYEQVHTAAMERLRALFSVPEEFSILFLQGGATLQFAMVPFNLLTAGSCAGYVASGAWAAKAIADGSRHGDVYVAWDGAEHGFHRMPRPTEIELAPGTRYLHVTSNETIDGVQLHDWPEVDAPLVADMSSDILSRPVPWDRFDLVYAGAQKNLAPAGLTVVIVRDAILHDTARQAGSYLRYDVHQQARSLHNTPPVFPILVLGRVLEWMDHQGGLAEMQARARRRSDLLYAAIEASDGFYRNPVDADSRSSMNVVFRLSGEDLEARFLAEAAGSGFVGLKGHRSVGGCRASIYNAMPVAGVESLVAFMADFRSRHRATGRS